MADFHLTCYFLIWITCNRCATLITGNSDLPASTSHLASQVSVSTTRTSSTNAPSSLEPSSTALINSMSHNLSHVDGLTVHTVTFPGTTVSETLTQSTESMNTTYMTSTIISVGESVKTQYSLPPPIFPSVLSRNNGVTSDDPSVKQEFIDSTTLENSAITPHSSFNILASTTSSLAPNIASSYPALSANSLTSEASYSVATSLNDVSSALKSTPLLTFSAFESAFVQESLEPTGSVSDSLTKSQENVVLTSSISSTISNSPALSIDGKTSSLDTSLVNNQSYAASIDNSSSTIIVQTTNYLSVVNTTVPSTDSVPVTSSISVSVIMETSHNLSVPTDSAIVLPSDIFTSLTVNVTQAPSFIQATSTIVDSSTLSVQPVESTPTLSLSMETEISIDATHVTSSDISTNVAPVPTKVSTLSLTLSTISSNLSDLITTEDSNIVTSFQTLSSTLHSSDISAASTVKSTSILTSQSSEVFESNDVTRTLQMSTSTELASTNPMVTLSDSVTLPSVTLQTVSASLSIPSSSAAATISTVPSTTPEERKPLKSSNAGTTAAIVICVLVVIVLAVGGGIFYYRRFYHARRWIPGAVAFKKPWSFRNATYDDENMLIMPSMKEY